MKSSDYILYSLLLFTIVSCGRIEVDQVGRSSFYIRNETLETIYYSCQVRPEYTGPCNKQSPVNPNCEAILIYGLEGIIGMHLRPEDVFTSIVFCHNEMLTDTFYVHYPVDHSLWEYEIQDGYTFWENTHYILTIR